MKNIYIYPKVMEAKKKFVENSIKILRTTIDQKANEILRNAIDYSNWDATYDIFAFDEEYKKEYIEENFVANTFKTLDIDYISIYDMKNNLIWNGVISNGEVDSRKEFFDNNNVKVVEDFLENPRPVSGIGRMGNSNYFFALSPIIKSSGKGEPKGYMIFSKKISLDYINDLGRKNNMKISYIMSTRWNYSYFEDLAKKINGNDSDCKYYDDDRENHYILFRSMIGNPIFILRLNFYEGISTKDISVYQERYISIFIGFILMVVLYLASRNRIVKPLEDLSDHIKKIIHSDNFDEIEEKESTLEVEELIHSFNKLIKKINVQNKQIESINDYLTELSYIDPLTKLHNRRMFREKFEELLISAKKNDKSISIILTDIDYFKNYNDFYGHIMGDKTLMEVATCLKESFDSDNEEYVFRYGGEEFIMLLYDKDFEESEKKVIEIQERIRNLKIEHEKSEISNWLTISSGYIRFYYKDFVSIDLAVDRADKALYKAKANGRNRYEFMK
jgi:diguanylate cyclase (GGDEF)-like protein